MSKLPSISGRECVRALERAGFYVKRQEGSHIIPRRDTPVVQLSVPDHPEMDRDRGTLRAILRRAGIPVEQFVGLL